MQFYQMDSRFRGNDSLKLKEALDAFHKDYLFHPGSRIAADSRANFNKGLYLSAHF